VSRTQWQERWRQPGGGAELTRLALPLVLSSSFWTLQITIDRMLLTRLSPEAISASVPGVLLFWTPLILLQYTSNFATTFVAQYLGAGRKQRIGPAVWQSIYFSLLGGVAFQGLQFLAPMLVRWGGHAAVVQEMELTYFQCLCFAALPILVTASVSSFFAGRGSSWTVLLIDAVGLGTNALLAYAWIFGNWGFPALGIAGAGWATVAGSSASALLGLALMFRPRYQMEFATLSGWRFEAALFRRLLRYGLPNGGQWALDALSFTVFMFLVGKLGKSELAATNVAFTINLVAIMPMLGMGQAVGILVGQRLGQDRPEIAERTTWTAFRITWIFMTGVAVLYLLVPELFLWLFNNDTAPEEWAGVARLVPILLRFVAVYSLFDSVNLIFSFALRGAGDTRFVTVVSLVMSWPLMVVPTWVAWRYDWGLYWPWAFASTYIIFLAVVFLLRFRTGKWKSMRVIESVAIIEEAAAPALVNIANVVA
jgi:MATE family multidrug resistance protein